MTNRDKHSKDAAELRQKAEALARKRTVLNLDASLPLSPEDIQKTLHELRVHQVELELQNEELRAAQEELEESRKRYFDLYDLAPAGYVTLSERGLILKANLAASVLLGMDRSALLMQPLSRFIHKEGQDAFYLHRKKLFETGEAQDWDQRLVRADGTDFWAHLTAAAVQDRGESQVCRVVIIDISERRQASEILIQAKEDQFENVFHESPIGIAVYNDLGMMRSMNKAFQEIYGMRDDNPIKGASLFEDPFLSRNAMQSLCAGGAVREEVTVDCTCAAARDVYGTTKTGTLYLDVQITPLGSGPDGAVSGYMVQVQDISARKQAEKGQRELSRQLILAHEDERRMISRDLHDGVGQDLVTIKIGLDDLAHAYPDACPGILKKITIFSRLTGKAIADIRDLAYEQHPLGLEQFGFAATIAQHVKGFSEKSGIDVDLSLTGIDNLVLDDDININLFRLIQEALRNIQNHAQAKEVAVKVVRSHLTIIVRIQDDGIGFDPVQRMTQMTKEKRMGLRSMQERATLLGGTMRIRSQPGKGTKILVELPLSKEAA